MPDSEDSRPETDFRWVTDLPSYSGLLPVHASSLLPRFSLFSLFRSRPSIPDEAQLDPLFDLAQPGSARPPSIKNALKGLSVLADYVGLLKTSCISADGEDAEQWILKAMEAYLVAISVVCNATFEVGIHPSDREKVNATVPQYLRGLFTIYNHFVGSSRRSVTSWLDTVDCNLLASPYPTLDSSRHLCALFEQTRTIINSLQHAARATSSKTSSVPTEVEATRWEGIADSRMEWLRLYADHVRGLNGIAVISGDDAKALDEEEGTRKKRRKEPTKAEIKAAEKREKETPMRIAIEADLLRMDLAISMATAKIGDVKRRARAVITGKTADDGESEAVEDEKEISPSRKRRALTDESDLDTAVDVEDDRSDERDIKPKVDGNGETGEAWEVEGEAALLETLQRCKDLLDEHHADVLTAKIERSDWLYTARESSKSPSPTKASTHALPGSANENDPKSEDDSDTSSGYDNDLTGSSEGEDLSYPCPLRTLFRLHDRYEEQRLAVWLALPVEGRGKMGAYMRGTEGRVGAAWDVLGLRLLIEHDSDTLEAFGLSLDKHDKFVELASRRNAKKIKKRGQGSSRKGRKVVEVVI